MTEAAVASAASKPRRRASMESTYDSARAAASSVATHATDAADRAVKGVSDNPLVVLAGGIAAGVVAGILAPRSEREQELLAPVGKKLRASANDAKDAAIEAGRAELAAVGLSRIAANEQVGKLVEGLGKAISSAGAAAKDSRKRK